MYGEDLAPFAYKEKSALAHAIQLYRSDLVEILLKNGFKLGPHEDYNISSFPQDLSDIMKEEMEKIIKLLDQFSIPQQTRSSEHRKEGDFIFSL